jgi:hypothetical protein
VLCESEVEFVVIGGVSANLHGSARVTFDLDICYSRSKANLHRLVGALLPFRPRPRGFPQDLPFLWDESALRNGTLFTLTTTLGDIDLLAEVSGVGSYPEVKAASVNIDVGGRDVAVLSLPVLIRAKRAAGRPKDMEAIHELESLLEAEQTKAKAHPSSHGK